MALRGTTPSSNPMGRTLIALLVALSARVIPSVVEESASPTVVRIIGFDYAFRAPEHVKAGRTTITFINRGKKRHEFNLSLLAPGVSPERFMAALKAGTPVKDLVERTGGVLFAEPGGKEAGASISTDLLAGRTYVAICIFRDTSNAPPHHALGMFTVIRPEGTAPSVLPPLPADTVVATDYAFTYPRTLSPGRHRFVFVNHGAQRHEVSISRFKAGVTVASFMAVDKAGGDVDPLFDSGVGVLHSYGGKSPISALEVELLPGREYYLECNFSDTDNSPAHNKLGMFGSIRVSRK